MLTGSLHTVVTASHRPGKCTVVTYELSNQGRFYRDGNGSTIIRVSSIPQSLEISAFPVIFATNPVEHPCSVSVTVFRTDLTSADKKASAMSSLAFGKANKTFQFPLNSNVYVTSTDDTCSISMKQP